MIELDQDHPGPERYPLVRDYRCGQGITHAWRPLIRHNRQRFSRPLLAGVQERGTIRAQVQPDPAALVGFAAGLALEEWEPQGLVAVLSRTG